MAHTPRNTNELRTGHSRDFDALNQGIEAQERQTSVEQQAPEQSVEQAAELSTELETHQDPDRPASVQKPSPALGMGADMVSQNQYQNEMFKYNNAQLALRQEQQVGPGLETVAAFELGEMVEEGRDASGHGADLEALNRGIEGQERGDREIDGGREDPGHDAAVNELNQGIERAESGDRQQEYGAAREQLEKGIESPEPQQQPEPDIQQQPGVEIGM